MPDISLTLNISLTSPDGQLPLPDRARTRDGAEFNPRLNTWSIRDAVSNYRFAFASLHATPTLIASLKRALSWYLGGHSSYYVANLFSYLRRMLQYFSSHGEPKLSAITATHILNYRASLSERHEHYLNTLRGLFTKIRELGLPGITDDAVTLLKKMRLRSNPKGEAVLTMDTHDGPYSEIEHQALFSSLESAHSQIATEDYLLAWLFLALGHRPIQYACLKVRDVFTASDVDDNATYFLNVPRAKQPYSPVRSQFKPRALTPSFGIAAACQRDSISF